MFFHWQDQQKSDVKRNGNLGEKQQRDDLARSHPMEEQHHQEFQESRVSAPGGAQCCCGSKSRNLRAKAASNNKASGWGGFEIARQGHHQNPPSQNYGDYPSWIMNTSPPSSFESNIQGNNKSKFEFYRHSKPGFATEVDRSLVGSLEHTNEPDPLLNHNVVQCGYDEQQRTTAMLSSLWEEQDYYYLPSPPADCSLADAMRLSADEQQKQPTMSQMESVAGAGGHQNAKSDDSHVISQGPNHRRSFEQTQSVLDLSNYSENSNSSSTVENIGGKPVAIIGSSSYKQSKSHQHSTKITTKGALSFETIFGGEADSHHIIPQGNDSSLLSSFLRNESDRLMENKTQYHEETALLREASSTELQQQQHQHQNNTNTVITFKAWEERDERSPPAATTTATAAANQPKSPSYGRSSSTGEELTRVLSAIWQSQEKRKLQPSNYGYSLPTLSSQAARDQREATSSTDGTNTFLTRAVTSCIMMSGEAPRANNIESIRHLINTSSEAGSAGRWGSDDASLLVRGNHMDYFYDRKDFEFSSQEGPAAQHVSSDVSPSDRSFRVTTSKNGVSVQPTLSRLSKSVVEGLLHSATDTSSENGTTTRDVTRDIRRASVGPQRASEPAAIRGSNLEEDHMCTSGRPYQLESSTQKSTGFICAPANRPTVNVSIPTRRICYTAAATTTMPTAEYGRGELPLLDEDWIGDRKISPSTPTVFLPPLEGLLKHHDPSFFVPSDLIFSDRHSHENTALENSLNDVSPGSTTSANRICETDHPIGSDAKADNMTHWVLSEEQRLVTTAALPTASGRETHSESHIREGQTVCSEEVLQPEGVEKPLATDERSDEEDDRDEEERSTVTAEAKTPKTGTKAVPRVAYHEPTWRSSGGTTNTQESRNVTRGVSAAGTQQNTSGTGRVWNTSAGSPPSKKAADESCLLIEPIKAGGGFIVRSGIVPSGAGSSTVFGLVCCPKSKAAAVLDGEGVIVLTGQSSHLLTSVNRGEESHETINTESPLTSDAVVVYGTDEDENKHLTRTPQAATKEKEGMNGTTKSIDQSRPSESNRGHQQHHHHHSRQTSSSQPKRPSVNIRPPPVVCRMPSQPPDARFEAIMAQANRIILVLERSIRTVLSRVNETGVVNPGFLKWQYLDVVAPVWFPTARIKKKVDASNVYRFKHDSSKAAAATTGAVKNDLTTTGERKRVLLEREQYAQAYQSLCCRRLLSNSDTVYLFWASMLRLRFGVIHRCLEPFVPNIAWAFCEFFKVLSMYAPIWDKPMRFHITGVENTRCPNIAEQYSPLSARAFVVPRRFLKFNQDRQHSNQVASPPKGTGGQQPNTDSQRGVMPFAAGEPSGLPSQSGTSLPPFPSSDGAPWSPSNSPPTSFADVASGAYGANYAGAPEAPLRGYKADLMLSPSDPAAAKQLRKLTELLERCARFFNGPIKQMMTSVEDAITNVASSGGGGCAQGASVGGSGSSCRNAFQYRTAPCEIEKVCLGHCIEPILPPTQEELEFGVLDEGEAKDDLAGSGFFGGDSGGDNRHDNMIDTVSAATVDGSHQSPLSGSSSSTSPRHSKTDDFHGGSQQQQQLHLRRRVGENPSQQRKIGSRNRMIKAYCSVPGLECHEIRLERNRCTTFEDDWLFAAKGIKKSVRTKATTFTADQSRASIMLTSLEAARLPFIV